MEEITKELAYIIAESEVWRNWSDEEIVEFQLIHNRLCIPFGVFHGAVEKVLGRRVWIHEFGWNYDGLVEEFFGMRQKPDFRSILDLIPENKRYVSYLKNPHKSLSI